MCHADMMLQCYQEYGVFQYGGASLQIIVSKVESAPFHWTESLLRLALKSRCLNTSGRRQELGKIGGGVQGVVLRMRP
jgi:hypothetical protein